MGNRRWLFYALITTVFWGVWGAFIELPQNAGFPAELGYSVWALTMVPCALAALSKAGWKLDCSGRAVFLGLVVGLLGAGGQLLLFKALREGPAYLVFPIISLSPVVTVLMAYVLLKERARSRTWTGVMIAFPAMVMLSYQPPNSPVVALSAWLPLTLGVFAAWGVQAYVMKLSTGLMSEESIFFYMMGSAVVLIPVAVGMTDFSMRIEWGWRGPWMAAVIQVLNSIGALTLVYAMRYGKAIIVAPMTALAPVLTVIISLAFYGRVPHWVVATGMVLATISIVLMAESPPEEAASAFPVRCKAAADAVAVEDGTPPVAHG